MADTGRKTTRTGKPGNAGNTSKVNSGRKNGQAGTKAVRQPQREPYVEDAGREEEVRSEIILLCILAFSIFLIIANFGKCGLVGDAVAGFLFGIIGFSEYIFPVYLFFSSAFIISNRKNRTIRNMVLYIGLVLALASMVAQMVYSTDFESVKALYLNGYQKHAGGGFLCGGLFFLFRNTIGIAGVIIIMIIAAVILFVLITGISVVDSVKNLIGRIRSYSAYDDEYDDAQEPVGKRKNGREKRTKSGSAQKRVDLDKLVVYDESADREEASKNRQNKPRDFFDNNEEIHELSSSGEDFFTFNNGVEKIIMHDETEADIPVQMDRFRKTRAEVSATTGVSGYRKRNAEQAAKPVFFEKDDGFNSLAEEDVLADAIDGNKHPEVVNPLPDDYDPMFDSAFSSVSQSKNDRKTTEKKSAPKTISGKAYVAGGKYKYPTANLLTQTPKTNTTNRDAYVRSTAIKLKNTLENFGVNVTITNYSCGPAVTRFEMQPEQGVKVSKILGLADDIKLNLAAADIRIEAPIPGKAAIGIEVPNKENTIVSFRELIESDNFKNSKSKTAFAVGKDISGQVIVADIAKMPHLLIAGATGSGKSVCINTLIMSILYKAKPEEVKLIMIDPKMVELACYNGIPHLLIPVVTDPKKASAALNWAVEEMTRRYQQFAEIGVRNIQGYNDRVEQAKASSSDITDEKLTKMPTIVVIVDELADLMMVAHGDVEDAIVRLSQLARAAGIHLVIATQRPSVDVITGLIKANVPSRIAFAVSQGVDSRTILDMNGAEKLLGKGDMLFYPTGYPKPVRVQGAFVSDDEVSSVVEYLKKQNGTGIYDEEISNSITSGGSGQASIGGGPANDKDEYFVEAGRYIIDKEKASIGMLQRAFKIGFNRAARIMDQLAEAGVVGPEEGTKARKITMSEEQFNEYIEEYL